MVQYAPRVASLSTMLREDFLLSVGGAAYLHVNDTGQILANFQRGSRTERDIRSVFFAIKRRAPDVRIPDKTDTSYFGDCRTMVDLKFDLVNTDHRQVCQWLNGLRSWNLFAGCME